MPELLYQVVPSAGEGYVIILVCHANASAATIGNRRLNRPMRGPGGNSIVQGNIFMRTAVNPSGISRTPLLKKDGVKIGVTYLQGAALMIRFRRRDARGH